MRPAPRSRKRFTFTWLVVIGVKLIAIALTVNPQPETLVRAPGDHRRERRNHDRDRFEGTAAGGPDRGDEGAGRPDHRTLRLALTAITNAEVAGTSAKE